MPTGINVQSGIPQFGDKINDKYTEATTDWTIVGGGLIATNTDRVIGNYSVTFRTTSGTTRDIVLTPSTPIDTTGKDRLSGWFKIFSKNGIFNHIRCYTDSTGLNYYELISPPMVISSHDWNLNEFLKSSFTPVGTPDWTNVEQVVFNVTANVPPIFTWGVDGLDFYSHTPSLFEGTPAIGTAGIVEIDP